ncbi:hypothetical protein [Alkalicoccus luteus]|uniref:Type IV pilus assembly protein PilO n=1 Tax=Alkalicoccus luteus TaxID=1237094 RepID=A0A969TU99_9BACI|nr:hypothetical protein [Alkalicoccus luteus]NJP36756.1 hypothetical protein [Alkalicoccus luteus]
MTNRMWTIAGISVLTVGLALYFFLAVFPDIQDRDQAEEELAEEERYQQQLETAIREEAEARASEPEDTTELQRRLPVVRQTDRFLMDLNQAEEVAGARILSISMRYDLPVHGFETVEPPHTEDVEERTSTPADVRRNEVEDLEEEPEQDPEEAVEEEDVPPEEAEPDITDRQEQAEDTAGNGAVLTDELDGLLKQTATVEVRVSNYDSLAGFINELDQLVRFVNIESIVFLGASEDRIFDGASDIFLEVQVSSFYYEELEHLEHEAPVLDYPDPGEEADPFLESN